MAMFRYEAVDASSRILHGAMQASSYEDLANRLAARGLRLRSAYDESGNRINPASASSAPKPASRPAAPASPAVPAGYSVSVASSVKPKHMAYFLRQLSTMVKSGIPLSQSLRENLQYVRHPKLRNAVQVIAEQIDRGGKLSESMARLSGVFPAHVIGSVVCGELGGNIDLYLAEAAEDTEREAKDYTIGRVGWVLTKLTFLQVLIGLPIVAVLGDAMSSLANVLGGAAVSTAAGVPIVNELLQKLYNVALPIGVISTLLYILFIYVWDAAKRRPGVRYTLDCYRVRFYPWGKLHRSRSIYRFLQSLDRLLCAGIDVRRAWQASLLLCADSSVSADLAKGSAGASSNAGLTERFNLSKVLLPEEIGIVHSGERAGRVGESLSSLAASYQSLDSALVTVGRSFSISTFIIFSTVVSGVLLIPLASAIAKFYNQFIDLGMSMF